MYHIRIDYFDNKIKVVRTFFEYDYPSKENVVNDVLLPYLQEKSFIFGGAKVEDEGIRKVEIYETDSSIDKTVERVNGTASPMMAFIPYTREKVLRDELVPKVTRQLVQEVQDQIKLQKKNEQKVETKKEKQPLIFISHSSENEKIATSLVKLLRTLGFNKKNLFCSSVPGYDIPEGEDIYDTLAAKFVEYDIYVIFLLSNNYYDSVACLNEMGATWVLKAKYSTIVCPGFTVPEIKGAVNPRKMAVVLGDSKRVNGKLNQLKDHLIEFFHLPEVEDDTIWENDRNEFLKSLEDRK